MPSVLNAANEVAVAAFLGHRINLVQIPILIQDAMASHRTVSNPDLADILAADAWAREYTKGKII